MDTTIHEAKTREQKIQGHRETDQTASAVRGMAQGDQAREIAQACVVGHKKI